MSSTSKIVRVSRTSRRGVIGPLVSAEFRGVTLPAIAAIIGLAVAGWSLFRASAPPATSVPPGVAALVNQRPILTSDFISEAETEISIPFEQITDDQRAKVLHGMIDQELLVQRALALDLPETTIEVRTALADGLNAQVDAPALAVSPTDDELRAYYLAHRAAYASEGTMTVHDIVLKVGGYQNVDQDFGQAEADAEEAVYKLRSGEALADVMEHYGFVDSGRVQNDTEFDFAAKIHLGDKLYAVAETLNDGDISDPVEMDDGVHVLIMDTRVLPHYSDYEAVRAQVYNGYRDQLRAKAEAENLAYLRANATILLAPGMKE
jgi:parvulin-like peptidyl-prolyl isomerase